MKLLAVLPLLFSVACPMALLKQDYASLYKSTYLEFQHRATDIEERVSW
jgi:hypothetical protein